jgi:phospholipid transport system substrate-binding protein
MPVHLQKISFLLALNVLASAALLPIQSWAQATTPAANPSAASVQGADQSATTSTDQSIGAQKFIQDLGDKAIGIIADKSLTQAKRDSKYHDLLHDAFDIKTIGHFVIGRAFDSATPQQQQDYLKLFEQLVIKIYSDRLNLYSGETFHVKGARAEDQKDTVVNSEVEHPDGSKPTPIDWRVRQKDGKIYVIDVVVDGVSQSVTQRQEYGSIVQRDGMDGLLSQMRQRVQSNASPGGD